VPPCRLDLASLSSAKNIFDFLFLVLDFRHQLLIRGLQWDWALFAVSYQRGSVLHSLGTRGLQCCFTAIVSLSPVRIVLATHFLPLRGKHFIMSLEREEYKVNDCAEKAARFFIACQANPATKVKVIKAMRVRGYSDSKAAGLTLQMQVHCAIQKIKGEVSLCPKAAAAYLLLTLATAATAAKPALRMITPNQAAAPILLMGGFNASNLPSPERKVRKTLHQQQISKQIRSKHKVVHTQAHTRATTLVAKERAKPKDIHRTTAQVIQQVDGEFRAHKYGVSLSIPTINRYNLLGIVSTFSLTWGYEGRMPPHAFNLLMLAAESFIQINQFNSVVVEQPQILTKVNKCCGVSLPECTTKKSLYNQVIRATNASSNVDVLVLVKGRWL
jgi:hypothetical protein